MSNALELHAHYSKLFEAFAILPLYDISSELDKESSDHFKAGHYQEWSRVLQRLRGYLGKSTLDGGRYKAVKHFIDSEETINRIMLPCPECRFPLRETDRCDLRARFVELIKWQNIPAAGQWITGIDTRTPDEIQNLCLPILDEEIRGRADVVKQRLTILDEWKSNPDDIIPEFPSFLELLSKNQPIKPFPISPHPSTTQAPAAPATIEPLDTPAAFWEALRRMPMEVEWVNDSPRYTVPVHLLGYEDFNEDLRPLREAFEAALPKLKTKHLRLLHHDLSELLGIDRQRFRRLEALYNERNYALQFLPDDYPILRFEVAAPGRGLASPWQWVNPSIWTGFVVLMQYKQEVARAIYDKISAALDKPPYPFPTTAPHPGSPAPNKGCPQDGDTLDTAPPAALTVADLCRDGFTPDDVLALAREVGLADEAGRFCLWSRKPGTKPRKLGAVVGFCKALGGDAKGVTAPPLAGTIPERVRAVGVLLDVEIRTSKTGTGVAEKYRKATERALARRKPTH